MIACLKEKKGTFQANYITLNDDKNFVRKLCKNVSRMRKMALPPSNLIHVYIINKYSYGFSRSIWN